MHEHCTAVYAVKLYPVDPFDPFDPFGLGLIDCLISQPWMRKDTHGSNESKDGL